ncbi:hypothetical protein GN956_G16945 [Arapaima gigas]
MCRSPLGPLLCVDTLSVFAGMPAQSVWLTAVPECKVNESGHGTARERGSEGLRDKVPSPPRGWRSTWQLRLK